MNNTKGAVSIPLSTFGGLSTELSPRDIPEGGSPDNQDVVFVPGSVITRPGLARLHTTAITGSAPLVYQKTLIKQDGTKLNLYLNNLGMLYSENPSVPGTFTLVATVAPGSKCKSVTAFGKEWMVFNDGRHGTDIPRQFDGVNWDRVSQGGPAGNPVFAETVLPPVALAPAYVAGASTISTIVTSDATTTTEQVWIDDEEPGPNHQYGHWQYITTSVFSSLTVTTTTPHGLAVGGVVTSTGGTYNLTNANITSIISTTQFKVAYSSSVSVSGTGGTIGPVPATITRRTGLVTANTASAHGLHPGDMFTITAAATAIGGGISAISASANVITVTTASENGVNVGSPIWLNGVAGAAYNGNWKVATILSSVSFTIDATNFTDGTSSGGNVYTTWTDTKLFVVSAPTTTSLTYRQDGPDAFMNTAGTLTPMGQVDGGIRGAVMMFKTRSGYITAPSTPIKVQAAGGKKLLLSNIPIGPSNVTERIIAFTPVRGGRWFYLGVPVRDDSGNVISTSTVIADNTSTTAMFDFSDAALMGGNAVDIDGNNLFNLRALGNSSNVALYADRMLWGGDENAVSNFLNMGFEGGFLADNLPLGWTNPGGVTVNTLGDFGNAVTLTAGKILSQNAYRDYYGVEILKPQTSYTFKCWLKATGTATVTADFYDTNTSTQLAKAEINVTAASPVAFYSANFTVKTPVTITATTVLRIFASASVTIDEMSVIYRDQPYNERTWFASYVINPESVDDLTGRIGASSGDSSAIMDCFQLMDQRAITEESANTRFYFVTENRLHTTKNLSDKEPSGWAVNQIGDKCGACSMFSAVTGESWAMWSSADGIRIFDGGLPRKVSQEIQELWKSVNQSYLGAIFGVNDTENRRAYFGVPISASVPNCLIVLDYRYGESGAEISDRDSVKVSAYSGQMLVTDLSRKYTHWHVNAQTAAYLETPHGTDLVFGDVNGRSYYLDATKLHDDDYGRIPAYYVPAFGPSDEQERQLQLDSHRHLTQFMSIFVEGVGNLKLTPYIDALTNPANVPARLYLLSGSLKREMEIPQNLAGRKITYKVEALPIGGSLDAHFDLSSLTISVVPDAHSPVAGRR